MSAATDTVTCDACPIRCVIKPGRTGSCDRYGNTDGVLVRVDPIIVLERTREQGGALVPFGAREGDWQGELVPTADVFLTGAGTGTTYPDYKPAPFIVSAQVDGVDMVTVVTEAIFSYCGVNVKIDTDRHIGAEQQVVRAEGEAVGHVTTGQYGSQMLSIGGVNHLTGGSKREGLVTMRVLLALCNGEAVDLTVDEGSSLTIQAGAAPIINGVVEERMRVGCGSATIGMFARQWFEHVDEVVVVDDHITGVLSEHQAGRYLDIAPTGISVKGRRSTPGRYFNVARPGTSWGGTDIEDPLEILGPVRPEGRPAGPDAADDRHHGRAPRVLRARRGAAAGPGAAPRRPARVGRADPGQLRARDDVGAVHGRRRRVAAGRGDREPRGAHALGERDAHEGDVRRRAGVRVARRWDHVHGGRDEGAAGRIRLRPDAGDRRPARVHDAEGRLRGPRRPHGGRRADRRRARAPGRAAALEPPGQPVAGRAVAGVTRPPGAVTGSAGPFAATTPDGSRLHLQHGPIDLIVEAFGEPAVVLEAYRRAWDRFRTVLDELVEELPALRRSLGSHAFAGPVARRMAAAVEPLSEVFITPMAAVAGAVADEICSVMVLPGLERVYVNDGGDIALWLAPGQRFDVGLVPVPERPALLGTATIGADGPVRGIATSGRHGRSFSLGIADAVTVLAADAASADAAATVVANAVDLPGHPAIERVPASELQPDTDLGERPVTVGVGPLADAEIAEALERGRAEAERLRSAGLLVAAVLCLEDRVAFAGPVPASGPAAPAMPVAPAIPETVSSGSGANPSRPAAGRSRP